jgi:acyl dehydratase
MNPVAVDLADLRKRLGEEVAVSDWIEITQERIDRFADATDDHQWIHVDPVRATASPFATTIAHGFLTLSLVSSMLRRAMTVTAPMVLNYGLNRVRFVTPVPVGARVRGRFSPAAVEETKGALQVTWSVTVEREGGDRPCCILEWLVRYYPPGLGVGVVSDPSAGSENP